MTKWLDMIIRATFKSINSVIISPHCKYFPFIDTFSLFSQSHTVFMIQMSREKERIKHTREKKCEKKEYSYQSIFMSLNIRQVLWGFDFCFKF